MDSSHTARARELLGPDKALNVVQHCLLWTGDPAGARDLARRAIGRYVTLDYYQRMWRTLGFDTTDFADGGSDRLVDMLVAWGDAGAIETRLQAHRDAGASEVIVVPLSAEGGGRQPDWALIEALTQSMG